MKKIADFSKGSQINRDMLLEGAEFDYLNGGVEPSGKWNDYNTPDQSVAISEGGNSCGYVHYMKSPFWCGAHCYFLYNIKGNPLYLYYALKSQQERIMALRSGACMPNIKKAALGDFEFEYDDNFANQIAIANVFKQIDNLIEERKRQSEILDQLVKSRFMEMFGDPVANPMKWTTYNLLELGSCKNGMNFHYNDSGVDINCLGVGDFKDLSIIRNAATLPTVSFNEMPSEEYLLRDGDIVFVRSNGNKALVGRSVAVYPGNVPTTFSGFCIRYRLKGTEVMIPYLLQVLKAESMRMKMAGRGANIQNLNQQILGTLKIPVPPMEQQRRYADFVQTIDKSKFEVQKSLEKLELLKKSLMQKYFG